MHSYFAILLLTFMAFSCAGQTSSTVERQVGGPCQDCQSVLDFKILGIDPKPTDTLPGFEKNEPKIKITGTVFKKDGKTPAENIFLYIYHTDSNGRYQPSKNPIGWEKTHGKYRTWLKTGKNGKFTFYTFKPAPYPNVQEPEHIHIYIKEPHTIPYYIESYFFENDPKLTMEKKRSLNQRGGSGVIKLEKKDGLWIANRNIVLGLNIPDYD